MKAVLVVAAIVGLFALAWLAQGNDFFMLKVFAPRYEQVRRETFEQSKAYRQGMVQELEAMRFQYEAADSNHKAALASLILHRAADVDRSTLTPELASFIASLHNTNRGY